MFPKPHQLTLPPRQQEYCCLLAPDRAKLELDDLHSMEEGFPSFWPEVFVLVARGCLLLLLFVLVVCWCLKLNEKIFLIAVILSMTVHGNLRWHCPAASKDLCNFGGK